jgi:hypothetical protein
VITEQPTSFSSGKILFTWKRVLIGIAVIFVAAITCFLFTLIRLVEVKIPESYAAWTTGNLIVDYLNTHTNQWPRSWEDLHQATNCQRYVSIEKLRGKVKVDWDINFAQLQQSARTNNFSLFRAVTRPDGSKLYAVWGRDTDPNLKIIGYLKWTLTESNAPMSGSYSNYMLPLLQ